MKDDIGVILDTLAIVQGFSFLDQVRFLVAAYHMDDGLRRLFQILVASLFALVIILVILIGSLSKEVVVWISITIGILMMVLAILIASIPRKRH